VHLLGEVYTRVWVCVPLLLEQLKLNQHSPTKSPMEHQLLLPNILRLSLFLLTHAALHF